MENLYFKNDLSKKSSKFLEYFNIHFYHKSFSDKRNQIINSDKKL